jgi:hypothetical protein
MTNNAYTKNNGDVLLCSILCIEGRQEDMVWIRREEMKVSRSVE